MRCSPIALKERVCAVWVAHMSLRGEVEEAGSPVGLHSRCNTALLVDIAGILILKM